jgi:hypothetical protein
MQAFSLSPNSGHIVFEMRVKTPGATNSGRVVGPLFRDNSSSGRNLINVGLFGDSFKMGGTKIVENPNLNEWYYFRVIGDLSTKRTYVYWGKSLDEMSFVGDAVQNSAYSPTAETQQLLFQSPESSQTAKFDDVKLYTTTDVYNSGITASNVSLSGTAETGASLKGGYMFEGGSEGGSAYVISQANNANMTDGLKVIASGACESGVDIDYTIPGSAGGKYLRLEVTPKDSSGAAGYTAVSPVFGPIETGVKASEVVLSDGDGDGAAFVGETLTGSYIFEGGVESGTTWDVYSYDHPTNQTGSQLVAQGVYPEPIAYKVAPKDENRSFRLTVIPKTADGEGSAVVSDAVQPAFFFRSGNDAPRFVNSVNAVATDMESGVITGKIKAMPRKLPRGLTVIVTLTNKTTNKIEDLGIGWITSDGTNNYGFVPTPPSSGDWNSQDKDLEPYASVTVPDENPENYIVKMYVWDGTDSMRPALYNVKTLGE